MLDEDEKIFRERFPEYICGKELLSPYWDLFQEGFCCGQDKAKEWHNIEDEPPPVGETILVYYGVDVLGMAVLATATVDCHGVWYSNVQETPLKWQSINLPKD